MLALKKPQRQVYWGASSIPRKVGQGAQIHTAQESNIEPSSLVVFALAPSCLQSPM